MEYFKKDNTANIAVLLTRKCQLNCAYCRIDRNYPDMSWEILRKSIDLLFTSAGDNLELQFFGGEPLLRFDLVKKGISYCKKKELQTGKKITYLLTTNGLLLDDKKIKYFKKNKAVILLSLDGKKMQHIKNRPMASGKDRAFGKIVHNFEKIIENKADYFIEMTFVPENISKLTENIKYMISLGVKNIQLAYAVGERWSRSHVRQYTEQLKKIDKMVNKENKKLSEKISIYNFERGIEPVLASPQIYVDTTGKTYMGSSIVLENNLSDVNNSFYAGNVKNMKNLASLERTRQEQLMLLINVFGHDEIVLRNIYFGIEMFKFFKKYELKRIKEGGK
jgi:sulfatase maturation enzyme AslB (radical SAM superfamily)